MQRTLDHLDPAEECSAGLGVFVSSWWIPPLWPQQLWSWVTDRPGSLNTAELHWQPPFLFLLRHSDLFPCTWKLSNTSLSFPFHSHISSSTYPFLLTAALCFPMLCSWQLYRIQWAAEQILSRSTWLLSGLLSNPCQSQQSPSIEDNQWQVFCHVDKTPPPWGVTGGHELLPSGVNLSFAINLDLSSYSHAWHWN